MNFTLELKNIPLSDRVAETWWQALWANPNVPAGTPAPSSPWKEILTLPERQFYTFSGVGPEGVLYIMVWGRVPDPEGIQDYWIKLAERTTGVLRPREGETVIVDMAAMALSLPLLVVGGLAVAALGIAALKRR